MKYLRAMLLGTVLVAGSAPFASAQSWGYFHQDSGRDRDRGRERDHAYNGFRGNDRDSLERNAAFQVSYQRGLWDARHGRRSGYDFRNCRDDDDRQAYRYGYDRGFQQGLSIRVRF
ncbi:MAG TPA: hypothetical protein VEW69_10535 [Alphaproteobacteria bacterium]|nr:hypothetical protein [Alphaproteobacteria bacterium]